MAKSLNAIGLLSIRQCANLLLSLVRVKILAVLLGPAGVGLISQATNLLYLFRGTAAAGANNALTVLVADAIARKEFCQINRILVTAFYFLAIIGSLILGACALLSEQIAHSVFGKKEYAVFVIVVAAASWVAIQLSLITGLFRGLLKIRAYTFSFLAGFLFAIVTTIFLVLTYDLMGAILSIFVAQVINYLIALKFFQSIVQKQFPEISILKAEPSWDAFRQILKFFGPLLLIYLVTGLGNLILRGEIIRCLGEDANGYYQVAWGISLAYMTLIEDTRRSYLVPRISSCLDNQDKINHVQNNILRIYMIALPPFLIILLAFREIWIPIVYSQEFLMAGSLLLWQFAGDLLATFRINITSSLIPKEKFAYLILEKLSFWAGWIGFSLWLMPQWNLIAIPLGYFAANLALAIVSVTYQQIIMNFYLTKANRCLLLKLLPLLSIGIAGTHIIESIPFRLLFTAAVVCSILLWLPDSMEKYKTVDWFKNKIYGL